MELHFFRYTIPFKSQFQTAGATFKNRQGIIIQLKKNGITAWGEAAPLPGFSAETFEESISQVQRYKLSIRSFFETEFSLNAVTRYFSNHPFYPSLQFGIFTATAFYLAQKSQQALHHFLFKNSSNKVKLNAVIDLKRDNFLNQVEQYVDKGFDTLKLKVGPNWPNTIADIEKIQNTFDSLKVRLDANQSWSPAEANQYLTQAEPFEIEYCEEPIKEPTISNLKALKSSTTVSIALDETMAQWPHSKEQAKETDVLIVKPMVVGRFETIKAICSFAQRHQQKVVFTSSLGTGIERLMTSTLASGLGTKHTAHGLNTGGILTDDVWSDESFISNGYYTLPEFSTLESSLTGIQSLSGLSEI